MVKEELFGIDERRDLLFSKMVAVYVGWGRALCYGEKREISADPDVKPYKENGVIMLPVEFFADTLGTDRCDLAVDGEYAPISELCEKCGLFLHTEANGLAIYSREDLSDLLDWTKNTRLMRNISEAFMFEDVSGDEMLKIIIKRFPKRTHPRLIFTDEKLATIKGHISLSGGDKVYKKIYRELLAAADKILTEQPFAYDLPDGIRLLSVCRGNATQMLTTAAAYLVSGDERYAKRAYETMINCAEFKDFNPYHFLDVGEMAVALGLCYDWLYNWMGEERRAPIRRAIIDKAIYPINEDFDNLPRRRSWDWRGELADNWRLVISGVTVAAMAIIDELSGEELEKAKRAIEQPIYDIRRSLSLFAPYGGYEEGHAYWYYGMKHYSYLMASLLSCAGTDFGYIDLPGMRMTDAYMFSMNGTSSTFDYHDCDLSHQNGGNNIPPETMLFASVFNDFGSAIPRIEKIMSEKEQDPIRRVADLYLYDPKFLEAGSVDLPLDNCLPIAEVATVRTGFDREAMWLGFHCDDPIGGEGHDHMDCGSFVMDALGENFFFDLAKDDYTLPNYINCYRVRDEGHNVLVINPDMGYSMKWGGEARICDFGSTPDLGFAIGDLSGAYRDEFAIKSYKRGAGLDRSCRVAVIKDEAVMGSPAEIYWFAHTRADIKILEGGRRATLTRNGKKLYATIIEGEGAVFSILPAKPLPTSPVILGQNENEGVRKLAIHLEGVENLRLTVAFAEAAGEVKTPLTSELSTWINLK